MNLGRRILNQKDYSLDGLFKLTLISDTHISTTAEENPETPSYENRLFYTVGTKLNKFFTHIKKDENKPDCILQIGDVIEGLNSWDYDSSFDLFMNHWNTLDIPRGIVAGNHDYTQKMVASLPPDMTQHEYISWKLGYGDNPVTAGSKMNYHFSVEHPLVNIKFIAFESNQHADGHFDNQGGFQSEAQIAWIENLLKTCEESVAVIYTHKFRPHTAETEAVKIESMITRVNASRPDLKIILIFGHSHPSHPVRAVPKAGNYKSFTVPALVDNLDSLTMNLYIDSIGGVQFETESWSYLSR